MKTLVGVLLLWAAVVSAAPRLDTAAGSGEIIISTVVPDSQDPNLYYFFPRNYRISQHGGKMQFTYYETKNLLGVSGAYAVMVMSATVDRVNLDAKIQEIKAQNPNAKFAPITVINSTISQMLTLPGPTLEEVKCQTSGNTLGQDVGCELVIKTRSREVFIKAIRRNLSNVLSLTYSFAAQVNGQVREVTHSLPIIFGDVGDGNYFFDGDGNPIPDEVMEEYKALLLEKEAYYKKHINGLDLELPKLKTVQVQCAGQSTTECRENDKKIKSIEKLLSNSKWLKILKRLEELKKELGIKN